MALRQFEEPLMPLNELNRLRAAVTLAREQLSKNFRTGKDIENCVRKYTGCLRDLRLALQSLALEQR